MAVSYKLQSSKAKPIEIKAPNNTSVVQSGSVPNLRCPHCMHMGAFTAVMPNDFLIQHVEIRNHAPFNTGNSTVGIRSCPNPECRGLVFVVMDGGVVALPSEVLDFDATDIPGPIASSLEEAVKCHSTHCYKAAALIVRRVLEELCEL